MKTVQEIAQWVIDNRYPKSENNCGGVDELICPKCKTGRDLKYKRYFMFGKVCGNCGSYVKLPTHPDYGK